MVCILLPLVKSSFTFPKSVLSILSIVEMWKEEIASPWYHWLELNLTKNHLAVN
jgi:hypothetical protein